MAKPPPQKVAPKVAPKMIKPPGFDPNRNQPTSDDPTFQYPDMPTDDPKPSAVYEEGQRFMVPSKRDNPVRSYCKGGKVISTRKF
jgi:hypothetical protein